MANLLVPLEVLNALLVGGLKHSLSVNVGLLLLLLVHNRVPVADLARPASDFKQLSKVDLLALLILSFALVHFVRL